MVYEVDEPHLTVDVEYKTVVNKANEAMAYLQFILDFYNKLPEHIVFMHAHRSEPSPLHASQEDQTPTGCV